MTLEKIKIVALGDSITFGFPYSPKESWVEIVRRKMNLDIINKGVNGDLTSDMLARFNRDVIKEQPQYVIILGGANDAYGQIDKDIVLDNIKEMCRLSEENNIIPIIAIPTPTNDKWEEYRLSGYRSLMQGLAEEKGYILIDFYNPLLSKEFGGVIDGLHVDGLHPSLEGYLAMAEVTIELLRNLDLPDKGRSMV